MKRLLSIEFQKLWLNQSSRTLTLAYFVILTFIAGIAALQFKVGVSNLRVAEQGIFDFPYIWHFNTYIAAILKIFLAIVIVSLVANEYSYGTIKQNLIDGLSKKEFVLSKFLMIACLAAASTLFVFFLSMTLGLCFSATRELSSFFSQWEYLLAYFVKLLGFFSFCLFLSVLIRRSAFALGFLFLWYIFESITGGILVYILFPEGKMAYYFNMLLPLEAMSNLIVEPFTRLSMVKSIGTQIGVLQFKDYGVHWYSILIVLIWTGIFVFLSHKLLQKRDL